MCRLLLPALLGALVPPLAAQNLPSWAEAPPPPSETSGNASDAWGDGGGVTLPDDPSPVPVDGGLALLALAGGAYAARRLRSRS